MAEDKSKTKVVSYSLPEDVVEFIEEQTKDSGMSRSLTLAYIVRGWAADRARDEGLRAAAEVTVMDAEPELRAAWERLMGAAAAAVQAKMGQEVRRLAAANQQGDGKGQGV